MNRIALHLIAGAAFCGLGTAALAADYGAPMPGPGPAPIITPYAEPGGGWYLRGDVGVGATSFGAWEETSLVAPAGGVAAWNSRSMSGSTFLRGGVGYQFNSYLRGDITAEYRTTGSLHGVNYIYNGNRTFADAVNGHWSSTAVMANAYVDFGEFWGLTPFVGAGVGVAYNQLTGLQDTGVGANNLGAFGRYGDSGKANFAWALHAGLGYEVNRNLKLEIGYRYMNMGDAKSGVLTCYNGTGGYQNCNSYLTTKKLVSNDIHVGMRWMLNPPPPPVAQPIPVFAKN